MDFIDGITYLSDAFYDIPLIVVLVLFTLICICVIGGGLIKAIKEKEWLWIILNGIAVILVGFLEVGSWIGAVQPQWEVEIGPNVGYVELTDKYIVKLHKTGTSKNTYIIRERIDLFD